MIRWILSPANSDEIRFTVLPSASRTVTLNNFTAPFGCVVDWGDNSFSAIVADSPLEHTYTDAGARQIVLRGALGGFWNNGGTSGKNLVSSLDKIASHSLVSLNNSFRGCTSLRSVVTRFDAPNLTNLQNCFYQCGSITSSLPALWQAFPGAAHAHCFTQSCKSYWAQYNSGCGNRQYVAAVPGRSYWDAYGTGCAKRGFVPGSAGTQAYYYYNQGKNCPENIAYVQPPRKCGRCGKIRSNEDVGERECKRNMYCHSCQAEIWGSSVFTKCCPLTCDYRGYFVGGSSAYYSCSSGGTCRESGCTISYSSGQSAYYRCAKSGGTCSASACPYPYANESSYNAALNAGWA